MPITTTLLALRRRLLRLSEKLGFLAPLLIRVAVGVTFATSGYGKLTHLDRTTEFFDTLGIPLPALNAAVASSTEFFGGILLLLGLGARLVVLPMAFTMLIAIITAKREEIDGIVTLLGFEEVSYLVMFLVIALIGAGPLSLDGLIARRLDGKPAGSTERPVLGNEPAPASQS